MSNNESRIYKVPRVGIEPTLPKELDFESSASTVPPPRPLYLVEVKIKKIVYTSN